MFFFLKASKPCYNIHISHVAYWFDDLILPSYQAFIAPQSANQYPALSMLLIDGKHVIDAFRAKKDSERGKYAHLKPKLVLSFLLNGWIGNVYHGINLCSLQEVFNVPVRVQQFKTQSYGIINVVHLFFSEKSLFLTLMNRCRSASSGWWQSCRCT